MLQRTILLTGLLLAGTGALDAAENRLERVQKDRADVTAGGLWVYNDLNQGFAEARRTGKPLAIVFR
ncbi:MAG: hypothetical protein FJ386_03220 [Verrucomicrobia bacterium]|nr:hypothetical protein [Verrucomicrobiota bacterium]